MSLMRKVLLAGSTNPWLRDRATKTAFVRRSVSRFMPGEQIEDAIGGGGAEATGHHDDPDEARREPDRHRRSGQVTQHYLEVLDRIAASGLDAQIR